MNKPDPKPTIAVRMADATDELHKLKAEADRRKVSYTLTDKPDDRPEPLAMGYARTMGNIDVLRTALAIAAPAPTTPAKTITAPAAATKPTLAPKITAPVKSTRDELWDQYAKIRDPIERSKFFNANRAAMNRKTKLGE